MRKLFWIVVISLLLTGCQGRVSVIKQVVPNKLVVLTFDDAREDNYSFVAPLLQEYRFGATFYICEFFSNEIFAFFLVSLWQLRQYLFSVG